MMQLNLHSRKITDNSVDSVFERRKTVRPRSRPDRGKGRYTEAHVGAKAAHFTFLSSALLPVLIRVSIAIMKHYDQKKKKVWGGRYFFQLILPHWCSSLKEVRRATQSGKEPGGGS